MQFINTTVEIHGDKKNVNNLLKLPLHDKHFLYTKSIYPIQ